MGTKFSVLVNLFFKRIEKDKSFFRYFELDDNAAMQLAEERADTYLHEAIGRLMLQGSPTVDFGDRDEENKSDSYLSDPYAADGDPRRGRTEPSTSDDANEPGQATPGNLPEPTVPAPSPSVPSAGKTAN